jgi:TolA-binding protein
MMKTVILLLAASFLAVGPVAADTPPAVKAADGQVRVGKPSAWHQASPGMPIQADEFLSMEIGSHVTLTLGDGSETVLSGKALLSGRRLANSKTDASRILLSDAVRRETLASLDFDADANSAKSQRGDNVGALGHGRRKLSFMGEEEEEEAGVVTDADFAESKLRLGDARAAVDYVWLVIADPDSPAIERSRAHLVLGRVDSSQAEFQAALREFDSAIRSANDWVPKARDYRAEALVQRGQAHLQIGDDAAATADFEETCRVSPLGQTAARANFLLGALALSRADPQVARQKFAQLASFPELARAADELMHTGN